MLRSFVCIFIVNGLFALFLCRTFCPFVCIDDALHELVPHDVLFAELDESYAFHAFEYMQCVH